MVHRKPRLGFLPVLIPQPDASAPSYTSSCCKTRWANLRMQAHAKFPKHTAYMSCIIPDRGEKLTYVDILDTLGKLT